MNSTHTAASSAALQGDALHAFLDETQELLNDYDHDNNQPSQAVINHEDRVAAAVELMEQQSFAPATVTELERVHDFWLMLQRPEAANAVLQAHRQSALQAHQGDDFATGQISLALSDIQSRLHFARESVPPLLLPAAQLISQLPPSIDPERYWNGWQFLAEDSQAFDIAEQGVDLRRAQERQNPDLVPDQAVGDALASIQKAELAHKRSDSAGVTRHVQAAINQLRDADSSQEVDFDHWMQVADRMLPLAPQSLPALLMACEQQLARTESPAPSQAVKAHRKVKIARLQAMACYQLGQLEAAIQLAPQGHFGLTDDPGDPFTAHALKWMIEAGRLDLAAPLALESALHSRPDSALVAYKLALANVNLDQTQAPTWALILAWAQIDSDFRHMLAQEPQPPLNADWYLDVARTQDHEHPVIALIEGMRFAAKRQMDKALPLLERSVGQHPELADTEKLPALWAARFAALPLEEALARPFPDSHGGHWCYGTGVLLDDENDLAPLMGGKKKMPPEEARESLALRYYELGLQRFEHFWATSQGRFKDADLHIYSMLCNNLGIKYRFLDRYDEAADLHRRGLASSPFSEHHDGLLWCAIGKGDDTAIVAEAEQLWHFALENGYGRHNPFNYFSTVAYALYKLDRDAEISIWLERLDQWYEAMDDDDKASERRDYLAALMALLDFFSASHPELVLPRLRAHQEEVRALKDAYVLRRLACAMEAYPEHLQESLDMHKESASYLKKDDDEDERRMSREGIERTERKLAEAQTSTSNSNDKPWWKFW